MVSTFGWQTLSFLLTLVIGGVAQAKSFITIGTGGVTGVYYPTGGAICRMVNANQKSHGIRCSVEATGGSEYNVNMMNRGDMDLAMVQSDVGSKAWQGEVPFAKKMENLRSVLSIHPESMALVARKDANIGKLDDVRGKRVNIGNPGSGQHRSTLELLSACGVRKEDLKLAGTLKAVEMPDALRDNKLDAYFYMVGHPTANIKDIATSLPITLVPLQGSCIDRLVARRSYYVKAKIPAGLYRGVDRDVPTFGLKATLLTTTQTSNDVVYQVVRSVMENLEKFKQLHPAYRGLTAKNMTEGLTAPLHPGAKKYFKERGLQ